MSKVQKHKESINSKLRRLWTVSIVSGESCIELPVFIGDSRERPFLFVEKSKDGYYLHDMSDTCSNMAVKGVSIKDIEDTMKICSSKVELSGKVLSMTVKKDDIAFAVSEFIKLMSVLYTI